MTITQSVDGTGKQLRRSVGISLMGGEEADAAVQYMRENFPDARVADRDCYFKIERDDVLDFDMRKIGEIMGRPLTTEMFLVAMSTYYGRMVRSNDKIQIFAEILPERFRD